MGNEFEEAFMAWWESVAKQQRFKDEVDVAYLAAHWGREYENASCDDLGELHASDKVFLLGQPHVGTGE